MKREDANLELLCILGDLIIDNPDLRFSQVLNVFGFVKAERPVKDPGRIHWQNEFYMEPNEVLKRVEQRIKDVEESDK